MKNKVKFCPKCRSINVEVDSENRLWGATMIHAIYICKDCGFISGIFPEIEESKLSSLKYETKKD